MPNLWGMAPTPSLVSTVCPRPNAFRAPAGQGRIINRLA